MLFGNRQERIMGMAENKYGKRMLKKARAQGWLSVETKAKFERIIQERQSDTHEELAEKLLKHQILTENQIEQLKGELQEETLYHMEVTKRNSIFHVKDLYKSYKTPEGEFHALKGINLTIYQGEILGVLGFSGSGKSTLLNILGLLTTPDPVGEIYFNGSTYRELKPKQRDSLRNKQFGFIFQESHLLAHLNAIENVALPLRLQNISESECIERSKQMLLNFMTQSEKEKEKVFFSKKPAQLSGGQKQRLAAARAMVHQPQVIFADEPTGNLDFDTGQMVMDILLKAAREKDATVILVTHNPSQARRYCNRFVWMENGLLKGHLSSGMESTMRLIKQLSGKDVKIK